MSQKLKIFNAMLALDEFTSDELARFAGVTSTTVQTTLSRIADRLEKVGTVETGRRGGQYLRYRLTHSGREAVENELADIFRAGPPPKLARTAASLFEGVPDGLAASDDTIERLLPKATSPEERAVLLSIAEDQAGSALQEIALADPAAVERLSANIAARIAKIRNMREENKETIDAQVLEDELAGESFLAKWAAHFRLSGSAPPRSLQLQVWADAESEEMAKLAAHVTKLLESHAQVAMRKIPNEPFDVSEVGDAVVLILDSAVANAKEVFTHAYDVCHDAAKPLFVFDGGYSSSFRNFVLHHQPVKYLPDVRTLDRTSMLNEVRDTSRTARLPIRASVLKKTGGLPPAKSKKKPQPIVKSEDRT